MTLLATQWSDTPLIYDAKPRIANKTIKSMGTIVIMLGSFSIKAPSSMGCISAGMAGSVAARITLLIMYIKKRRQYGTTWPNNRRYKIISFLSLSAKLFLLYNQLFSLWF